MFGYAEYPFDAFGIAHTDLDVSFVAYACSIVDGFTFHEYASYGINR